MPSSRKADVRSALQRSWQSWVLLAVLVIFWGSSFAVTKIGVASVAPEWLVALRLVFASLFFLAFNQMSGRRLPPARTWPGAILLALTGFVLPFLLIAWGSQHIASGLTGILMAIMPLIVPVLAHFLLPDERMGAIKLIGVAIGFAGAVMMIGPQNLLNIQTQGTGLWAQLAMLLAATSYGIHSIITRRLEPVGIVERSTAVCLAASVIAVPWAAATAPLNLADITASGWICVLALAIFPTALASIAVYRLLEIAGANFMSLVNYLIPVYAVLLGVFALDESLTQNAYTGLALVLAGIVVNEIGFRRKI